MGSLLLVWLQMWQFSTAYAQSAQELQLFSGLAQDAWVGYIATRAGKVDLFVHHIDTSGYENIGRNGLCLSCEDTVGVRTWNAVVGEKGWLYAAWSTPHHMAVCAIEPEGLFQWKLRLPQKAHHIALLPHPEGGVVLLLEEDQTLSLQGWSATGSQLFATSIDSRERPQRKGRFIPSGLEGFLVLWESYVGDRWELRIQKWRWNGEAEQGPRSLSGLHRSVEAAEFIGDGYGGILGVYESASIGGAGKDLYLIRYNRNGNLLYEKPLCLEAGDQQNPRLYKRGTDLLIVWEDNRNQDWDLYFQRVEISSGKPLLPSKGVTLVELPGPQRSPHLILDYFQNEMIAVWIDNRHLQADIYMQRYSASVKPQWEFAGRPLATNPHQQHSLRTATQDFQYFWVAYLEDKPQEGTYPHIALVTTQGEIRLHKRLAGNLSRPYARISQLQAYSRGKDLFLLWADDRDSAGKPQLYLQQLSSAAPSRWPAQGMPIAPQPTLSQRDAKVIFFRDTLWVLWQGQESDVESDLFAQALIPSGKKVFLPKPFLVCGADRVQNEANWIRHPHRLYASWTDNRSMEETGFDLYLRSVWPPAPEAGWRAKPPLQNSAYIFFTPGENTAHHVWQEEVAHRYQILYAHAPLGEIPNSPTLLSPTSKPQRFLQSICTPEGVLFVTFCEESPGPYEQNLRIFALSPHGEILWQKTSPFPYRHHLYPSLLLLQGGDLLLTALATSGSNRWDLVYARFSPTGELREKGILLTPVPERSRWQILQNGEEYWLLLQMTTGHTLHQGRRPDNLKPIRLPGAAAEAVLIPWQEKVWIFWTDERREKLYLTPLSPQP
ncbi:MAG: hypothetical protein N2170_01675 [Bacteroidia bacterium]|nr:hypothetical protein [Bacteroidia bacterium]